MDSTGVYSDIDKISLELLRSSKCLDVFPTPVSDIIAYSNLIVRADIDLSKVNTGFFSKAGVVLKRALSKVRGLLDRSQKTIYLDLSQGFSRQSFVKLHECGHEVLPWQRDIHDILEDDDFSLDPSFHEAFEAEANYFASVTLFQHDRFSEQIKKNDLSINAAMHLAKFFGGSVQATLRRYVECSKNRCALVTLEKPVSIDKKRYCKVRNTISSKKFEAAFGDLELPSDIDASVEFVKDYISNRKFVRDGSVRLATKNGPVNFRYEFFNNNFRGLVFIYPVGEKKSSQIKVIITGK